MALQNDLFSPFFLLRSDYQSPDSLLEKCILEGYNVEIFSQIILKNSSFSIPLSDSAPVKSLGNGVISHFLKTHYSTIMFYFM